VEQAQIFRDVLSELAVELDLSHLPPDLRPGKNLLDTDSLRHSMPELTPPLSSTIRDDREDRL